MHACAEPIGGWGTQQSRWVYECVFRLGPDERGGPGRLNGSWAVHEPPLRDRALWGCVVHPYVVEQGSGECRAGEAVDVWLDSDWQPSDAPEEGDAEVVVEDGLFDLRV